MANCAAHKLLPPSILVSAILWSWLVPETAQAGPLTFTVTQSGYEAQAVFTPVQINHADYIQVQITNLESLTPSIGNAISSLQFKVVGSSDLNVTNSALHQLTGTPESFSGHPVTGSVGRTNSVSDNGPFPNSTTHWGFNNTNSVLTLAVVGNYAYGGSGAQPIYLIVGPNVQVSGRGTGGFDSHSPDFYTSLASNVSTTFLISASGFDSHTVLTPQNITNVVFGYGTSFEEHSASGTGSGSSPFGSSPQQTPAVPEPSSILLLGLGGIGLAGAWARSRRMTAGVA